MPTPSIQTLVTDAQQVLNLDSISAVRSVVAVALANANVGTPLNPNLTTQQLWNEFYQVITKPKSDIESIIANQLMKFLFAPTFQSATLASATITGDLTVDTSTLKVDSTNNRVGILTASPAQSLDVASGSLQVRTGGSVVSDTYTNYGAALSINAAGGLPLRLQIGGSNAYEITSANVHQWSNVGGVAGTAMTLNSTGLGVGASPTEKLTVWGASTVYGDSRFNVGLFDPTSATTGTGSGVSMGGYTNGTTVGATFAQIKGIKENSTAGNIAGAFVVSTLPNGGTPTERLRIDSVGNVGVGVTPSAWNSSYKVLQVGGGAALFNNASGSNSAWLTSNFFFNSSNANTFIGTGYALMYRQVSGEHAWLTSTASGTAGGAATMTQMMTLDASGNLIWSPASSPPSLATNGQLTVNATSNTNLRFSYRGSDGTTRVANITLA